MDFPLYLKPSILKLHIVQILFTLYKLYKLTFLKLNNFYPFTNLHLLTKLNGVATGKNEKEYSWHVPAMKFIGMKQLV